MGGIAQGKAFDDFRVSDAALLQILERLGAAFEGVVVVIDHALHEFAVLGVQFQGAGQFGLGGFGRQGRDRSGDRVVEADQDLVSAAEADALNAHDQGEVGHRPGCSQISARGFLRA